MTDFKFYDAKLVPAGFGLRNTGSTCYFNAVIQALISCPAFNKSVAHINRTTHGNSVIAYYSKMMSAALKNPNDRNLLKFSPLIWAEIFKYVQTRSDIYKFSAGQQDAGEGLHMFMESIEKFTSLQDLFKHRYESTIYCPDCRKEVSRKNCEYILFDVPPNLEAKKLKKFKDLDASYGKKNEFTRFYTQPKYICRQRL